MRLHARLRRLEGERFFQRERFVLPPENRAAMDHLIRVMQANPEHHEELQRLEAVMAECRGEGSSHV